MANILITIGGIHFIIQTGKGEKFQGECSIYRNNKYRKHEVIKLYVLFCLYNGMGVVSTTPLYYS